jgi:DNA-binding transcriptional ArsR family regulator
MFNRMVEYQTERLDRVFGALSDQTRRAILRRLANGDALVTELAAPFNMSLAAVSKHVQVLERAGLVRRTIHGREHRCALSPRPLREAADCLEYYRAFWEVRLDALEQFIATKRRRERKRKTSG